MTTTVGIGTSTNIISINKDLSEKDVDKITRKSSKASKYIVDKKIVKTIFIKNKIINYINIINNFIKRLRF